MLDVPVQEGDVLAGKYRIERVLGQGGMGLVAAAFHLQLQERVAIKFLLPEALRYPEIVARFAREARAAVKIRSEHVSRTIDVGTLESGTPFIVMEYLEGRDLGQLLEQAGPLAAEQTVDFVLQACEALAEAHRLGIVHRDLKPANLFLTARADGTPCVKVLDFGISKMLNDGSLDSKLTQTRQALGSPWYMSPEQLSTPGDVDARTDIWSLGVIVFELSTGEPPFPGDSLPAVCTAIVTRPTPSLVARRPDLDPGLEDVVLRALSKSPEGRYASLAEFAAALAPFGTDEAQRSLLRIQRVLGVVSGARASQPPVQRRSHAPEATPASRHETLTGFGQTRFQSPAQRRAFGAAIAVVGLTAALALAAVMRRESPAPSAAVQPPSPAPADPVTARPRDGLDPGPSISPAETLALRPLAEGADRASSPPPAEGDRADARPSTPAPRDKPRPPRGGKAKAKSARASSVSSEAKSRTSGPVSAAPEADVYNLRE